MVFELKDIVKSFEVNNSDFTYGLTGNYELLSFTSPFKGLLKWYYDLFYSEKDNDLIKINFINDISFENNEDTVIIFNEKPKQQNFLYNLQLFNFRKEDDNNMFLLQFTHSDLNDVFWSFSNGDANNEITFYINREHYGVSLKRKIQQNEDFPLSKIPHMIADCGFDEYLNFFYNDKQVFIYPLIKTQDIFYQILTEEDTESLFIVCPLLQ